MHNLYIKVFGIQRVGSNYFYSLYSNFNIKYELNKTLGWKHDLIDAEVNLSPTPDPGIKVVVLIKNPYTWYSSIRRWVTATPHDFPWGEHTVENLYKRYNLVYENYKTFLTGNMKGTIFSDGMLVRYEDLIADTEGELNKIADRLGFELKQPLHNPDRVELSKKFTEERRKYYLEQKPDYDKGIVDRVNLSVDWKLMEYYSYYPL